MTAKSVNSDNTLRPTRLTLASKADLLGVAIEKLIEEEEPDSREECRRELKGFTTLFNRYLLEGKEAIDWSFIQKLPESAIQDYGILKAPFREEARKLLEKVVVVKLNGGLGTSMGCKGSKSLIPVRKGQTFLDLTVQQLQYLNKEYKSNVPLVLMNSFNTDEETSRALKKFDSNSLQIHTFSQSCHPRIYHETLTPVAKTCKVSENLEAWYPPGHGDFYESFQNSGLLDKFIVQGRTYCFISNIDNLGATVDLNILKFILSSNKTPEFVMELTEKTKADVKGGTLIQYEGKLRLLELAQVPKEHVEDFKSVKTFKLFNTNNLWIQLPAIKRVIEDGTLNMEIIVNPKTLANGAKVLQLETAVGSAMKCFNSSIGINVPRSRFLPVKKTNDMLLLMSNLYTVTHGYLNISPERSFENLPIVNLGEHFVKVDEFTKRFATMPDIVDLDHLTVSGNVTFGEKVVLKGTVIIIANHGERIDIPSGAILENKIVTGNLRLQPYL